MRFISFKVLNDSVHLNANEIICYEAHSETSTIILLTNNTELIVNEPVADVRFKLGGL